MAIRRKPAYGVPTIPIMPRPIRPVAPPKAINKGPAKLGPAVVSNKMPVRKPTGQTISVTASRPKNKGPVKVTRKRTY